MLRLLAPAKLNLTLRVIGRRADGYHELETLFERIDLADELAFTPQASGITVTCSDPGLDCGPANLITKAATLLQQTSGVAQGASIHLAKRIPIAAGLGGGSSDAATTLIGLNRLWNLRLPRARLLDLAAQLGSDVPFFLHDTAFAIGQGRGDVCELLTGQWPTLWHVLVVPRQRLSTKDVYEGFDHTRVGASGSPTSGRGRESVLPPHQLYGPINIPSHRPEQSAVDVRPHADSGNWCGGLTEPATSLTICLHALRNGSPSELAKGLENDLEPEAIRRCPVITEMQTQLCRHGGLCARVSGSGSSVFGLCHDASHAQRVAQALRTHGSPDWFVGVVTTCDARLTDGSCFDISQPLRAA